jgi:uncharacterized protein YqjF (DUF2071 family)/predicted DCC family thiol-disulfide oxidoreductase YuxK
MDQGERRVSSSMAKPTEGIDRDSPRIEPIGRVVMRQCWSNLTFLHWPVLPESIRPLVPAPLAIDTWDGHAYVGLVAFAMSGVRLTGLCPLPGCSRFPETNIRTYVHLEGRDPGVWFFSLDAASWPVVHAARRWYGLNYYHARMSIRESSGGRLRYGSRRDVPGGRAAGTKLEVEVTGEPRTACPGTIEDFLIERYALYALGSRGLIRARVRHDPYAYQDARLLDWSEELLAAAGVERPRTPPLVHYSRFVDVRVGEPQLVQSTSYVPMARSVNALNTNGDGKSPVEPGASAMPGPGLPRDFEGPIVVFDGVCGLCNRFVDFTIRRDKAARFRYVANQSEAGQALVRTRGGDPRQLDTVYLIEESAVWSESSAILRILRGLGGIWGVVGMAGLVLPRGLRDALYRVVARNRYRWFGKRASCRVPTAEERSRFLT